MKLVTVIIKAFNLDEVRGQWEECCERRYGFWRAFLDEQVRRSVAEPGFGERCAGMNSPERRFPPYRETV